MDDKRRKGDNTKFYRYLVGILFAIVLPLVGYVWGQSSNDVAKLKEKVDADCNRITVLETDINYIRTAATENRILLEKVLLSLNRIDKAIEGGNGVTSNRPK